MSGFSALVRFAPLCLLVSACGGEDSGTTPAAASPPPATSAPPPSVPESAAPAAPAPAPAPNGVSTGATSAATAEVDTHWTEDATRSYFNGALELPWAFEMGAWRDRNATAQGSLPFASLAFVDQPTEQVVRWDVTDLVRQHGADLLIRRSGGSNAVFYSREESDPAKRPRLIISRPAGLQTYTPVADTSLNASTYKPQGQLDRLASAGPMLLRFDVGADATISRATLELTATSEQYGNQTLEVFRTDARPKPIDPPQLTASTGETVLQLSGGAWAARAINFQADRMAVNADGSLTVRIPAGGDTGSPAVYLIPTAVRAETMFARAVMKVHADWTAPLGGKFPGLSNTGQAERRATQCAWGGRLANGTCWSARTNRQGYVANTPFAETHLALQPYIYRVNRITVNGDTAPSSRPVPKGRFFVLDQMVRLNSIGADGAPRADGEIAYWLNGELINRMTGVLWRNHAGADTLPSEYWLNVYEGGTGYVAPRDHTVTFSEIRISTQLLPFDAAALARLNN